MQPDRLRNPWTLAFLTLLISARLGAQSPCFTYPDSIDRAQMQKATFSLRDSLFIITANIHADYRIIGYSKPDVCSSRQILFSVFTKDVDQNPYHCQYGAFYSTSGGFQNMSIKFRAIFKGFVRADLFVSGRKKGTIYFERRWVSFTKG
jgi:hypothetical protein